MIRDKKKKTECNCLSSCNTLRYEIETSQLTWNWKEDALNSDNENKT